MKRARALMCLVLCAAAAPAFASSVHAVLRVDLRSAPVGRRDELMAQATEIVSRRLMNLGIVSPRVTRDGEDRIVADIVGYSDVDQLRESLLPHILSFRRVDEELREGDLRAGRIPRDVEILPHYPTHVASDASPLAIYRGDVIAGERIEDAHESHDPHTGQPTVLFRFDDLGKTQFAEFTRNNVGKRFAILLDGEVLTAPRIDDPITSGRGEITGSFTEQEAADLVNSIRAGAAPVPWSIVEIEQRR